MFTVIAERHKRNFLLALGLVAISHYILEGIWLNPLIIWTLLPLYVGAWMYMSAFRTQKRKNLAKPYGFLICSLSLSYWYHLAWFFDWGETATGSSTSALIFMFAPIYSVVFGFLGWTFGYVYGSDKMEEGT